VGAILPVHLYGRLADLDGLATLAREARLPLIEDAAQAVGARPAGSAVGQQGAACLSFFPTKNLGGWGDGGAVVTNDAQLAKRVVSLRAHGVREPGTYGEIGFNSRLDAIQAAVLEVKLGQLARLNDRRRRNAAQYGRRLAAAGLSPWIAPPPPLRDGDVCHLYTVRIDGTSVPVQDPPQDLRAALQAHLDAAGIGSAVYYPRLLCDQPAIAPRSTAAPEGLAVARAAAAQVLSLPVHESLPAGSIDRVVAALASFVATVRPAIDS
jgi:dTDP-4-amino-4,6-dideoxygalactose transaminase